MHLLWVNHISDFSSMLIWSQFSIKTPSCWVSTEERLRKTVAIHYVNKLIQCVWKTRCSFSPLRATALGISSSVPERVCHYYSNTLGLLTKLSQQHCPSAWLPMTYLHTILNTAERTTWPSAATTTGSTTALLRAGSVFCSPLSWRQGGPSSAGQWSVLTLSAAGQSHTQTCWKWCNRAWSFYLSGVSAWDWPAVGQQANWRRPPSRCRGAPPADGGWAPRSRSCHPGCRGTPLYLH